MIKIGITGQSGFLGKHLYNILGLYPEEFERISFEDSFFGNKECLCEFVKKCDVIIHLAAMNRSQDSKVLYETNLFLVRQLIDALEIEKVHPYVLFSSSTQEESQNEYGISKKEGRILLEDWAKRNNAFFSGLIVPNVYGPFGRPNYNSFIATFCYKLTHKETPLVIQDNEVQMIYVGNLCKYIIEKIRVMQGMSSCIIERAVVPFDFEKKVTDILALLENYKYLYFDNGFFPELRDENEVNLFNTFCCYMDLKSIYPRKLVQHKDSRGMFVETIRLKIGGQISYSTTVPGVTRGNHFHTRKIERFVVIKGKARIQLRKLDSDEVINFYLDGATPSFIDMPIWYIHNITNIGTEDLYTQFWINEWYNPEDGDTYFEPIE